MKTIKSKILLPMIFLIVLVPLATLLFFNVALRIYFIKADRGELKEAVALIETLSKQELSSGVNDTKIESLTEKLVGVLEASKLTDAKMLVFKGSELLYPKSLPNGTITASLVKQALTRLKNTDITDKVEQLKFGKTTYLMAGYVHTDGSGSRVSFVLLSREGVSGPIIRIINLILFVIMLAGIAIGVLVASRITGRMSKKIGEIAAVTDKIGGGDFAEPSFEKTDISEFSKLSQSITQMAKRLEASERSQRDFLQNASHELRTPLMSIQGYAEGIIGGIVPSVKEASEIIKSESQRLNTLVGDLLTLSRIESRTHEKKLLPMNLNRLLPDYINRLGGIAVNIGKEIILKVPQEEIYFTGDEAMMGQAVGNIITNCLRYANKRVEVSLLSEGETSIIRICDDGAGISENDIPHIFERFYKGKGGNFGLGLAIAKSAVHYQGGEIKAYNGEKGAVFEIVLKKDK